MIKGMFTVVRGMDYHQKNIDTVSNNLANLNSTGYKKEGEFQQILNQMGQQEVRQVRDFSQGNLVNTLQPLDLAIRGEGFFEIRTKNGSELTRNGKFSISEDGYLVNENGDKVMGTRGEINITSFKLNNEQTIEIARNGEIKIGKQTVDTLKISTVEDLQDLVKTGSSNFSHPAQDYTNVAEDKFAVLSGYIEESNVNPIFEMEKMIQINKDYEMAQKVVNSIDSTLERLKEIGRV